MVINMEKDVVCGMSVDPKSGIETKYEGKTYHFCSADCKRQFEANPSKYSGNSMTHHHGC